MLGPVDERWEPPVWLEPHQRDAARRVRASLEVFGGALLADAVGLGKTHVALAVGAAYQSLVVVVPAVLRQQWRDVADRVDVRAHILTHEALSRGVRPPTSELIVVDEAHRLRNPNTKRYDRLARSVRRSRLLLVSATPVVNRAADLVHLLRLFSSDGGFAITGAPSLESTPRRRQHVTLAFATAPVVIARSTSTIQNLAAGPPPVHDRRIIRAPTVSLPTLRTVLWQIDALRFPTVEATPEGELLRLHLLCRLSSSAAACAESVKRHLTYMHRARDAARRGETLSRAQARSIFSSEDELRLELDGLGASRGPAFISLEEIATEQARLSALLRSLSLPNEVYPKMEELVSLLQSRKGRKTIVFTTAVTTALGIARRIGWRAVAVIGSGRARIASGPIGVSEALSLFAPGAVGSRPPPDVTKVSTLVATDLVSEGLNLQDADGVVHYDLPWTPLRLVQRVGRVARLKSKHRHVDVYWFGSHPELETRLGLERRITCKTACQLDLGVIATSRVGRARLINLAFEQRELLARGSAPTASEPGYAVVRGPLAAAVKVVWQREPWGIPELVVLAGNPLAQQRDFGKMHKIVETLLSAPQVECPPPPTVVDALTTVVQRRLGRSNSGPTNTSAKRLARIITRHGYAAGRDRNIAALRILDAVLDCVQRGLAVGAERELSDLFHPHLSIRSLSAWLDDHAQELPPFPSARIEAALFGDGSIP